MNKRTVDWKKIIEEKKIHDIKYIGLEYFKDKNGKSIQKIKMYCKKHSYFYLNSSNVRKQSIIQCKKCKKDELWDFEKIKKDVEKIHPNYILKELKNVNSNRILIISCGRHDFYKVTYYDFFNKGYKCKQCLLEENNQKIWTIDECLILLKEKELSLFDEKDINDLNSYKKKHTLKNKEGYKYYLSMSNLIKAKYQNIISGFNPFSIDNINLWMSKNRPDYILLSDEYKNSETNLKFKYIGKFFNYNDEDRIFLMSWNNFKRGGMHPLSNITLGEEKVYNILNKHSVSFDFQKSFNDCRNPKTNRLFYFDFIVKIDNNFILNIEYDGEFHDKPIKHFGGEKYFENVKYRDRLKENYMKKRDIPVLRIKRKDLKNMEEIIINNLTSLKEAI